VFPGNSGDDGVTRVRMHFAFARFEPAWLRGKAHVNLLHELAGRYAPGMLGDKS
jgi:hypothetical protein